MTGRLSARLTASLRLRSADFCRPRQAFVVDGVVRVGVGNGIADVLDLAADGGAIQRQRCRNTRSLFR